MNMIESNSGVGCPVRLPADSLSSRRIPTKSRLSVRGFIVARFPEEPDGRRLNFESGLERAFILLMLARRDVVSIVEQPFGVTWTNGEGRVARYTPDFLLTLTDGRRLAVEVKRAEQVRRRRIDVELALIAAQLPPTLADCVALFTDEDYQAWEGVNAGQLHEARKRPDAEADAALVDVSQQLRGNISVGDLSALLGLGARGFWAVLRAIFDDKLRLVTPGIIGPRSRVSAGGTT